MEPAAQNGKKASRNRKKGGLGRSFGGLGRDLGDLGKFWGDLGESWGGLGAILDPQGPIRPTLPHPWGTLWELKTAPKPIPKRSKIEAKNQDEKKPIQDDLGPVLGRSWVILGRLGCHLGALETLWHYPCRCFVKIHFFDVKTVRRRLWDQLWPTKAPK